jgi:hypothetical protein
VAKLIFRIFIQNSFQMNEKPNAQKIQLDTDVLLDAFNLKKEVGNNCTALAEWLSGEADLTGWQAALFEVIYQKTTRYVGGWNEEELKMKLVSHILLIADIDEEGKISTFFERILSGKVEGKSILVKCDCLVASPLGLTSPKKPYFFLQEFKRSKGDSNDPEGQMLGAMLLAQTMNNDDNSVYGSWLVGNIWYFAILQGKQYCMSQAFDALNKVDLMKIIYVLSKLKKLILERN